MTADVKRRLGRREQAQENARTGYDCGCDWDSRHSVGCPHPPPAKETPTDYLAEMFRLRSGFPREDDARREAERFLEPYEAAVKALVAVASRMHTDAGVSEDGHRPGSFVKCPHALCSVAREPLTRLYRDPAVPA